MSNASVRDDAGLSQGNTAPACQWSFNRAHEFHHISGDSIGLFHRLPIDLARRHVSLIDDPPGSWSARLHRMFLDHGPIEQSIAAGPAGAYAVFHIPVRDVDGLRDTSPASPFRPGQHCRP